MMAKRGFFSTEIILGKHIKTASSVGGIEGAGQQAILWENDGISFYTKRGTVSHKMVKAAVSKSYALYWLVPKL